MDLVGLSEVAEMAGVSKQAVINWRTRFGDFPSPSAELASGPVWEKDKIEQWLKKREGYMESTNSRVIGPGKLETRDMGFTDFDSLELATAIEVEVNRADNFKVTVTAEGNVFDHIDLSKSGSTLKIRLRPWISFRRITVQVTIGMPELRGIKLSGATRATVNGFKSDKSLDVVISGASKLRLNDMKAGDIELKATGASHVSGMLEAANCRMDASGASTVELEGRGYNIRLELSGASHARFSKFGVENMEARVSGASGADITFTGKLDADASGASRISYGGEGALGRVRISGASSLQKR